ncbi:hypothetical protein HPG69_019014, partial [Diceros bicornis minor]
DTFAGSRVLNQSGPTEFVFCVFTAVPEFQVPLFLLFLLLYLMILCNNTAIIEINHFLCDVPPVLWLACADICVHQAVLYVVGILVLTVPFLLICVSYIRIHRLRDPAHPFCRGPPLCLHNGCCS